VYHVWCAAHAAGCSRRGRHDRTFARSPLARFCLSPFVCLWSGVGLCVLMLGALPILLPASLASSMPVMALPTVGALVRVGGDRGLDGVPDADD